ncbi:MAG TPA: HAD family hydrolase [Clostridiaceae bacterium]
MKVKGIIFDMDNTILQSKIDFKAMKAAVYNLALEEGLIPYDFQVEEHTTSTIIQVARKTGKLTKELKDRMWKGVLNYEVAGMENAGLEAGALKLLKSINNRLRVVLVTNNGYQAALKALELTNIKDYFDLIVARDHMEALKPDPSGFLYVLSRYKDIPSKAWLSVGDSWIDGKASEEAGIPFILYGDKLKDIEEREIELTGSIKELGELLGYIK